MGTPLRAVSEPPHVAMLAGGEERHEPGPRLGSQGGRSEADGVEAQFQRFVADAQFREGAGRCHRALIATALLHKRQP